MGAAGGGRRHRDDRMTAIGPADRLALDRAIAGEIVHRHAPARRLYRVDDLSRDRPVVEAGGALARDRLEGRGEIVERDMVAGLRRAAVGPQIDPRRRTDASPETGAATGQRVGDVVVDRQALAGERGRGRDEVGEA